MENIKIICKKCKIEKKISEYPNVKETTGEYECIKCIVSPHIKLGKPKKMMTICKDCNKECTRDETYLVDRKNDRHATRCIPCYKKFVREKHTAVTERKKTVTKKQIENEKYINDPTFIEDYYALSNRDFKIKYDLISNSRYYKMVNKIKQIELKEPIELLPTSPYL